MGIPTRGLAHCVRRMRPCRLDSNGRAVALAVDLLNRDRHKCWSRPAATDGMRLGVL